MNQKQIGHETKRIPSMYEIESDFEDSARRSRYIRQEKAKSPTSPEKTKRVSKLILKASVGASAAVLAVVGHHEINQEQDPKQNGSAPEQVDATYDESSVNSKGIRIFPPEKS